jgi:hypothetical protein
MFEDQLRNDGASNEAPFVDPCWTVPANGLCCLERQCGIDVSSNVCFTLLEACPAACSAGFACVSVASHVDPVRCEADPFGGYWDGFACVDCSLFPQSCEASESPP